MSRNSNSFWPGLGLPRPKAIVLSYQKINPCQNIYGKKTSKSAKHACHYATNKKDPLNNNVFGFGHHNLAKVYNNF